MSFKAINLSPKMLQSLTRQGFYEPSSIQLRAIPKALKGETLMIQSATGTGKTLCFLIPIIENIDLLNQNVQSIIIAPTRELAQQIYDFAIPFSKEFEGLKIKLFRSGEERENTQKGLSIPPHIIIGTPGRLADILINANVNLNHINTIVLDEADMLLREGYFSEIDKIVFKINNPRFLVYSATLESNLAQELERYIGPNTPIINEEVMTASKVTHYLVDIRHQDINETTEKILNIIKPYMSLVFASKKETANSLYAYLRSRKLKVGLLTGDLSSRERKAVLRQVKNDEVFTLVCSDMAARGLDIPNVTDVINVDLPNNLEFYYHRAGRTGRFNKTGNCYTFFNNDKVAKPLALIKNGINFKYLILKDNDLVEGKGIEKVHPNKRKIDDKLQTEINKIKANSGKNKEVKPGYKKKQKLAIEKAKQRHRREIIRKDIRRQRIERYKKENQNNG